MYLLCRIPEYWEPHKDVKHELHCESSVVSHRIKILISRFIVESDRIKGVANNKQHTILAVVRL